MKFDTIIIGGGLAGLVCGIRLQEKGQNCVIISTGQSALHFSSGSLDLLGKLPDGSEVIRPLEAIGRLEEFHPYRKIGVEKVKQYVEDTNQFMERCGVLVQGNSDRNHYRLTPMGMLKQTWLTFEDFTTFENRDKFPWSRVAVINFEGFLDFYTQFIADSFEARGAMCTVSSISLPPVEKLRSNPTEMRSANIARVFDSYESINQLVAALHPMCDEVDMLVLPAVFGLSSPIPMQYLKHRLAKPLCLVATMPPSVPGIRTQQQLTRRFIELGGTFMMGDTVERGSIVDGQIKGIVTTNHGDIELSADNYVLASGSFFSRGIIARPDSVYEPVFNVDVYFDEDRANWYQTDVFASQPYMNFGVKTDVDFHPMMQGKKIGNLYAIGSILSGFNPMQEGCGAGVSILSAMNVADQIVK